MSTANDRLGAQLMMSQVASHVADAMDAIDLEHPGLQENRHDLDVIKEKLVDLLDKLEGMGAEVGV
jgi:hypothetical protein